jgi:hypothetical protein
MMKLAWFRDLIENLGKSEFVSKLGWTRQSSTGKVVSPVSFCIETYRFWDDSLKKTSNRRSGEGAGVFSSAGIYDLSEHCAVNL